jgi:hypothetical protein
MRTPNEIFVNIIMEPARDDLRREYAHAIQSDHPVWAAYILRTLDYPDSSIHPQADLARELSSPFERYSTVRCEFDRGFVDEVWLEPSVFMKHGDELLGLAPIVKVCLSTQVTFENVERPRASWREYMPELATCPAIGRVRELCFRGEPKFDLVAYRFLSNRPTSRTSSP